MLRSLRVAILCHGLVAVNLSAAPENLDTPAEIQTLGIAFDPSLPPKPLLDVPPRIKTAAALVVPVSLRPSVKLEDWGRIRIELAADGHVKKARVIAGRPPRAFATFVEQALEAWQFEPPISNGEKRAATIHVVYAPRTASGDGSDRIQQAEGHPLSIYIIPPRYPEDLLRLGPLRAEPENYVARAVPIPIKSISRDPVTGRMTSMVVGTTTAPEIDFGRSYPKDSVPIPWISGEVQVAFDIDPSGATRNFRVVSSSSPAFEPDAVLAVSAWHYRLPMSTPAASWGIGVVESIRFAASSEDVPDYLRPEHAGAWDQPPGFAHLAFPILPRWAGSGESGKGRVRVHMHLDSRGTPVAIDTVEATHPDHAGALRAALLASVFTPAYRRGQPVDAQVALTAAFDPRDDLLASRVPDLPALRLTLPQNTMVVPANRLDRAPRRLTGRSPAFTILDLEGDAHGSATIECVIDPRGRVREPRITKATHRGLAFAALQSIASWCFEPSTQDGRPVATLVRVPFIFEASAALPAPQEEPVTGAPERALPAETR